SQAGLALTGGTLGWFAGTTLQARRLERLPRVALLALGGVVLTLGIAVLVVLVAVGASGWWVLLSWLVAGCGMGLGMATTSVLTLRLAAAQERGLASSALQLSDNLGSVLGIAAAGAVFAGWHEPGHDASLFTAIYAGLAVVALLAAAVGMRARTPTRPGAGSGVASSTVDAS
ncbi:MAG: MFS transporter, partial [Janthinobacterium lividum]